MTTALGRPSDLGNFTTSQNSTTEINERNHILDGCNVTENE